MHDLRRRLGERIAAAQQWLAGVDRRLGGLLSLLKATFDSYNAHGGTLVSAAMGYYFFFTLFPLALALITLGSLFFRAEDAKAQVVNLIVRTIPVSREIVTSTIDQVIAQAGSVGILVTLSFIYAASGLFGLLLAVVNRAWECSAGRPSIVQRLLAIGLVFGLAVVFFLASLVTTALDALGRMGLAGLSAQQSAMFVDAVSIVLTVAVTAGLFLILFWKLPATRVEFADAWPAAVATAVVWAALREIYAYYLGRFTHYSVVYGSLAAIIGLLAWFYLTGFVILLGAELSAQIATRRGRGPIQCQR